MIGTTILLYGHAWTIHTQSGHLVFNNALASFLLDSACTRSAYSGYSISLASRSLVYINSNLQLLTLARTRPTDVMSLSKGHAFLQQKVCQGRHHHFRTQCQQESFGIGSHRHNHNRRNGQTVFHGIHHVKQRYLILLQILIVRAADPLE